MNKFAPPRAGGRRVNEVTESRRLRALRKAGWSRRLVR